MSDAENCSVLVSDRQQSALKKKLYKYSVSIRFLFSCMLVYRTIKLHLSYKRHWCIYVFKAEDVHAVWSIEATWDLSLIWGVFSHLLRQRSPYRQFTTLRNRNWASNFLHFPSNQPHGKGHRFRRGPPAASVKPWCLEPFCNLLRNTSHTLCSSVRRLSQLSGLSGTHTHIV